MAKTIYAILENSVKADAALSDLMAEGVSRDDISIVTKDNVTVNQTAEERTKAENVAGSTTSGALTGGAIGGIAGLLIGLSVITLPPIGGIFIAGPLASALGISTAAASTVAGAGLGALGGGLVGALVGLGIPEEAALVYEERLTNNGVLLGIACDNDEDFEKFRGILNRHGADNIVYV